MTRSTTRPDSAPDTRTSGLLTALRATAVLSTLNVLYQGATAGQVLMKGDAALEWHGGGAIALHVLTGLVTVAAVLWARAEGGPWWPAALSAVVFVATFVEAYFGEGSTLYIHVPLALILTVGTVWVTAWAFTASARTGSARTGSASTGSMGR